MPVAFYPGTVREAIANVRKGGRVLAVVIQNPRQAGEADPSMSVLEQSASLLNQYSISICLEPNTLLAQQFAQLYPIATYPAVYFIDGTNGRVKSVLKGHKLTLDGMKKFFSKREAQYSKNNEEEGDAGQQLAKEREEQNLKYRPSQQRKIEKDDKLRDDLLRQTIDAQSQSARARIQFRFPDGRCVANTFQEADSCTLQSLYDFVRENVELPFSNFSLSTTFPPIQLDFEPRGRSLNQYGLVPTGTVFVLPASAKYDAPVAVNDFIAYLLLPLASFWTFLVSLFSTSNSNRTPNQLRNDGRFNMEGNVARLQNPTGEDDDNNTWNGNSTQQQ